MKFSKGFTNKFSKPMTEALNMDFKLVSGAWSRIINSGTEDIIK